MSDEIKAALADHALWLRGEGGAHANLTRAKLAYANLAYAKLAYAKLAYANLAYAKLAYAKLAYANLAFSNLMDADLTEADLTDANLNGTTGNMREIRSLHVDTWPVAYTAETLQIGCQRHSIHKWRKWNTDAGRSWIAKMDNYALEWADCNLALVLQIIDANPATPTGHEKEAAHDLPRRLEEGAKEMTG